VSFESFLCSVRWPRRYLERTECLLAYRLRRSLSSNPSCANFCAQEGDSSNCIVIHTHVVPCFNFALQLSSNTALRPRGPRCRGMTFCCVFLPELAAPCRAEPLGLSRRPLPSLPLPSPLPVARRAAQLPAHQSVAETRRQPARLAYPTCRYTRRSHIAPGLISDYNS